MSSKPKDVHGSTIGLHSNALQGANYTASQWFTPVQGAQPIRAHSDRE